MSLTDAYYWSQIILTLIAFVAAIAAYQQIQTMKRLEIMKILEAPHVKDARMILYAGAQKTGKKWWRYDDPDFDEKVGESRSNYAGFFRPCRDCGSRQQS